MRVIFLGPPGVGKGTQATLLSRRRNIPHLATGDLLRDAIKNKTALGQRVSSFLDSGGLVPDELIIKLVEEKLSSLHGKSGYILDGFPRTFQQAEGLEKILEQNQSSLDSVVYLSLDDKFILDRITGRRSCPSCGEVYHLVHNKPEIDGTCKCGDSLVLRKDDSLETLKRRLSVYHDETAPLIKYYTEKSLLCRIHADGPLGEVTNKINEVLSGPPSRSSP